MVFIYIYHLCLQQCEIEVIPVDDGTPVLETNLGLHHLEYVDGKVSDTATAILALTHKQTR